MALFMVASALLTSGCDASSTNRDPRIVIDAAASQETGITSGRFALSPQDEKAQTERYVYVVLDVPDGSRAVAFKQPKVDLSIYAAGQILRASVDASLSAEKGLRLMHFSVIITSDQSRQFDKVVVTRIYEGPPPKQS